MTSINTRLVAVALGASVLALGGCGAPEPADTPPPPPAEYMRRPQPPELAGGPPRPDLAGGPPVAGYPQGGPLPPQARPLPATPPGLKSWREVDGRLVTAMAPIANPQDAPARAEPPTASAPRVRERPRRAPRRGQTHSADRAPETRPRPVAPAPTRAPAPAAKAPVAPAPATRAPPVNAPAAKPPVAKAAPPAPAVRTAPPPPKPVAVTPPAPVTAARPAQPTAPLNAKAPTVALQTPAQRLTAALSDEVADWKVAAPYVLTSGEPSDVTVSLPETLLASIQREAAGIGLTSAARTADVTATLAAEDYEVTPNGPQTVRLAPGRKVDFAWKITPKGAERPPIKVQIDAALTGGRDPLPFPLASLSETVAPSAKAEPEDFAVLPDGQVSIPGIGVMPSRSLLGGFLLLLAVGLLAFLARRAAVARDRARASRRRPRPGDFGQTVTPPVGEPAPSSGARPAAEPAGESGEPPPQKPPKD